MIAKPVSLCRLTPGLGEIIREKRRITMSHKIGRLTAVLLSAVLLCCILPIHQLAAGPSVTSLAAAQVTVRFHANGGSSEAPGAMSGEQGQQFTLPQTRVYAPMGLTNLYFVGWSERSSAAVPDYLPGDQVYLTRDMDLYAVFSETPPAFGPDPGQSEDPTTPVKPGTGSSPSSFTIKTGAHTKYMSGVNDGLFHPSQALTRAELAQMLYNIVVERPSMGASFGDVPSNSWYAPAVNAMAGLGILPGYSDGSFRPTQAVTRAESAAALAQLIPAGGQTKAFRDVPSSHPGYAAISAVGGYGLFSGDENGSFNPSASFQRAEAAVVFNKLLGRVPDTSAIYSKSLRYFPDVPTGHWAYGHVMEATTTHGHTPTGSGELWRDVQTEPVPLADGLYRINGWLYCVSGRQFLRSAAKDCFYFDAEGRYTTGDADLDAKLNALVEKYTNDSMTRDQKLRALYNYCRDNFSYLKRPLLKTGATSWEPEYASAFLSMKKGNCFSFSSLFCLLARELGQPAYTVIGGLGKSVSPHGWVEIKLDGTNYMFDPQLEWRYVHDYGRKSHNLFKVLPQNTSHLYTKLSGGTP